MKSSTRTELRALLGEGARWSGVSEAEALEIRAKALLRQLGELAPALHASQGLAAALGLDVGVQRTVKEAGLESALDSLGESARQLMAAFEKQHAAARALSKVLSKAR